MSDRKLIPGKFVWFELVTKDAKKAQAFYGEVLGWKVKPFPMGNYTYEMILTGEALDTMIGGYAAPTNDTAPSHWIAYVSVDDVDAVAKAAIASGGRVIVAPMDIPGVGRRAGILDPQGAELHLLKSATGDAPDVKKAPHGTFFWNELHTTDPAKALAFFEKILGYSHTSMDAGGGTYHILSSKDGVGRGGMTANLSRGAAPHWLPYVSVDDVDATVARAKRLGATIPVTPEDIPGVGRVSVLQDPTGASLAIMKPMPTMEKKQG